MPDENQNVDKSNWTCFTLNIIEVYYLYFKNELNIVKYSIKIRLTLKLITSKMQCFGNGKISVEFCELSFPWYSSLEMFAMLMII